MYKCYSILENIYHTNEKEREFYPWKVTYETSEREKIDRKTVKGRGIERVREKIYILLFCITKFQKSKEKYHQKILAENFSVTRQCERENLSVTRSHEHGT